MKYMFEVVKYDRNLPAMVLVQNKPGWRCRTELHWHKELELIYMVNGHLDITVNGKKLSLDNDGLFFCNSEEIHITDTPDDDKNNFYLVVMLSFDYMRNFYNSMDNVRFNPENNPQAREKIKESMKKLLRYSQNNTDDFIDLLKNVEIMNIYHVLLSECMSLKANSYIPKTPGNFSHAKRVVEYIAENYKETITLNDMAALVGLSPAYFSKYFKNITGTSFTSYLNAIRLDHAIKDMLTRNLSVTDAALENGFPNVKSYITMCKKVYDLTPAQYKKHYPDY